MKNSISKIKKKLILEALREWKKALKSRKHERVFAKNMLNKGWSHTGGGDYKVCLVKESIAVKFAKEFCDYTGSDLEVQREWEQWQCSPWGLKKHLPYNYMLYKGLLIQDRVLNKCTKGYWKCKDLQKLNKEFDIHDTGHNHGHSTRGKVKFFDWVYRRRDPYHDRNNNLKDKK
jgi:hypothetical protein